MASSWNSERPEERLPDEPIAAWAALIDYLGLPSARRTVGEMIKLYNERGEAGLPTPTESRQTLRAWMDTYFWHDRARDYDMLLASRVAVDVTSAMAQAREQRLRVASSLLNAAEGMTDRLAVMIRDIPTLVNIPPRDVAAIAKIAAELSRAENAPEQVHVLVDGEGIHVPVTKETVAELAESLRASIESRVGVLPTKEDGDGGDRVQRDEDHGPGEGGGG